MKRKLMPVLLLLVLLLTGCSGKRVEISSIADMKDKKLVIGVPDEIEVSDKLLELCPGAKLINQNDALFGVQAVSEGKYNAYVVGRKYLKNAIEKGNVENVGILDEPVQAYKCALGLSGSCQIPDFEAVINRSVERLIEDGTLDEMNDRWFDQGYEKVVDIKLDDNPEYILKAVTFGQSRPESFIVDGKLTGFDVELLYRICAENHWGMTLENANYASMLMGASTGKYDIIAANLYVTENRQENMTFSIPYRQEEISVAVYDESAGSPESSEKKLEYATLEDVKNAKSIAFVTGSALIEMVKEHYPDAEIKYFQTMTDCAIALTGNKVDAVVFDAPPLKFLESNTPGVGIIPEYILTEDYHFIISKTEKGEKLQKEFNEWLEEQRKSGYLEDRYDFWCSSEEPEGHIRFEDLPDVNGSVNIVTSPDGRPNSYSFDNGLAGYTVELIYDFCREKGYAADVATVNFDSLIPGLVTGKYDIGVDMFSYTEERAKSLLYTGTVVDGGVAVLVRTESKEGSTGFINTVKNGLRKTFITDNRYKLILKGLGITVAVTAGGFALANVFGAVFCAFQMSKNKALRLIAEVYDRIMQGTPMVVILMIIYYVIFGKTNFPGVPVAIFAFGIVSGASLANQFHGAIAGVDRGQTEAALALGFTKREAFSGIVFPQAARTALSGYFSELIGLMKGTSIVGYIAIGDLTKASDLIRSSTYDAFFPLLSVALIYFLISFVLLSLLKYVSKRLAPKRVSAKEDEK